MPEITRNNSPEEKLAQEIIEQFYCSTCKRELTSRDIDALRAGKDCHNCHYGNAHLMTIPNQGNNSLDPNKIYFANLHKTGLFA
jgi:hypothetical protein